MRLHDSLIGILLIVFAIAVALHARGFPDMPGQAIGPALFPTLVAAGTALAGLALLVAGIVRGRGVRLVEVDDWLRSPRRLLYMLLIAGGLAFYVLLSEQLGYFVTAPATLLMFLIATRVRLLVALPVAALVPLLIHYIFYTGLRVPLPWGVLTEHAW
jgi:putative tricarboxylic transport membrane protein